MRTLFRTAAALIVGLFLAAGASAQTLLNNTTLSAAVSATDTTIRVASATGAAAGSLVVIPGLNPEVMVINAVSGTTLTVTRGANGTQARPHASARTVFIDIPRAFYVNPPDITGTCTRTSLAYQPWVDTRSGIVWSCNGEGTNTTGTWFGGWTNVVAFGSTPTR